MVNLTPLGRCCATHSPSTNYAPPVHPTPNTASLAARNPLGHQERGRALASVPAGPAPDSLGHLPQPHQHMEILVEPDLSAPSTLTQQLVEQLAMRVRRYSRAELDAIVAAMPLVFRYAVPNPALNGWGRDLAGDCIRMAAPGDKIRTKLGDQTLAHRPPGRPDPTPAH